MTNNASTHHDVNLTSTIGGQGTCVHVHTHTSPRFARHEECADKIADFANCIALLDTGHRAPVK